MTWQKTHEGHDVIPTHISRKKHHSTTARYYCLDCQKVGPVVKNSLKGTTRLNLDGAQKCYGHHAEDGMPESDVCLHCPVISSCISLTVYCGG